MTAPSSRRADALAAIEAGTLSQRLLSWFVDHQRALPWRSDPEPYRVWVSEIMLQQTQVVTVLPYFARWMERFPTLTDLAEADLDDVLAAWSGLGYYRRARLLHRAARYLVESCGGVIPGDTEGLMKVPGIGRYTAGAIASIAFNQVAPIVDGNVIRVYARVFGIEGDVRDTKVVKELWRLATALVEQAPEAPGDYNQSVMELGALVCTPKKPSCLLCPLQGLCVAYGEGKELELPFKSKAKKKKAMHLAVIIARDNDHGHVLLAQRPEEGLFGGLWEFPSIIVDAARLKAAKAAPEDAYRDAIGALLAKAGLVATIGPSTGVVEHTLTHIQMTLRPFLVDTDDLEALGAALGAPWAMVEPGTYGEKALSSMMKKVGETVPG